MADGKEYNPLEHSVVQALLKDDACNRYECDEFVEALVRQIESELSTVYWNWNQKSWEDREDWQFTEIKGFAFRRYFWDDCDCGANSPVHAKDCRQIVEHHEWNRGRLDSISDPTHSPEEIEEARKNAAHPMEIMHMYMSKLDFSPEREKAYADAHPYPPCTCGALETWKERDHHLDSCSPLLPNLSFGEVRINWYKRIGRGMSTNVNWDADQWKAWFKEVLRAVSFYNTCMQLGHHKCRDEDAGLKAFSTEHRVQCKDCKYCMQFGANTYISNRKGKQ